MDETKEYGDQVPDPADAQTANPEAAAKPAAEEKSDKGKKAKKDKADKDGAQLEALTEKLKKAEQELESTKDQYQRMLAEYANYKRRTEQEKEQIGQFSRGEMLKALLPTLGLEEIPAAEQPFDPEMHHAVMREDADGVEPDTVTEVFQKGYRYGGRVLRPAMVKVAN